MSISRRYRPQTFSDITGQDAIKETLRKEVASGKLGHAYLFSGPRGVGKTTTARIFAKAVNCTDKKDGEPCNACPSCVEANEGRSLDVIEMDAASNTGVDNIREAIVEHVRFAPSKSAFKVYILDEAHMLSTAAWNAMLKTLEEPPLYALFILATTELHKVPATIISRCQRFDFKRIPDEELAKRLVELAETEKVKMAETVVTSIVRHSDGCVRDAETLLDQILALGEKNVTDEVASLVIPVSRLPMAAKVLSVCSTRELGAALNEVASMEENGIPLLPIFDDLIQAVRQLLLASDASAFADRLKNGDEGERMLSELVGKFTAAELGDIALVVMERRRDAKQGIDARFALELAVTAIALGVLPHGPGAELRTAAVVQAVHPPMKAEAVPSKTEVKQETKTEGASDIPLSLVQRKWSAFVAAVGEKNPSLTFILTISRPERAIGTTVTIRFQYAFHKDKILGDPKMRRSVEETMANILGVPFVQIESVIGEDTVVAEKRSEDMVTNILKAFGGQVVDEAKGDV